jgi:aryl-alcohol dehydrogenase-like predicted oxidoreductase
MEMRVLGKTNLKLSVLGMGCWSFGGGAYWGDQSQKDVDIVVNAAIDLGFNYFDTAEMYNNGASETSLGIALKQRRSEIIIGTKISPSNCSPLTLRQHLDDSLKRLGTNYVDIYMLHWPIASHSIEHFTKDQSVIKNPPSVKEAFATLIKLQEEGKIKYIGISNHGVEQTKEVMATGAKIVVNEMPYNLLSRAIEKEILPFCEKNKLGVFGYMALQQGLLGGKYSKPEEVPPPQAHSRHFANFRGKEFSRHLEAGCETEMFKALAEIKELAKNQDVSMAALSLAWAIADKRITSTLVGSRNIEELKMNAEAARLNLSKKVYNELNRITEPILKILGYNADYYEPTGQSRIH